MSSKYYTISRMKDKRGPDGYMYHAYGTAIDDALGKGKITPNDTWNPDKQELINRLRAKGAEI